MTVRVPSPFFCGHGRPDENEGHENRDGDGERTKVCAGIFLLGQGLVERTYSLRLLTEGDEERTGGGGGGGLGPTEGCRGLRLDGRQLRDSGPKRGVGVEAR